MPLVNLREHLAHTQDLVCVDGDVGSLTRCAARGFCCMLSMSGGRRKCERTVYHNARVRERMPLSLLARCK